MEKVQDFDKSRRLIIISFWVVILIGLPLWWKTTEVYRAQLPFTEIEEWSKWEKIQLCQNTIQIIMILVILNLLVDVDSMRTMKYSPMYQVTFSLMNGDPSTLLVDWDIKQAVVKYLKPFVDKISIISNLTVDSQIQHYSRLTFEPQKNLHNDKNYFYLTPDLLPHFINAAEWNLASAVSSYPTLNFILYAPSKNQSPLYIKDSKENNAFLIPRWGGVIINNPDQSVGTHMFTFDELKSVMSIFIMQLRGLLGVQDVWLEARSVLDSSINVDFMPTPNTAITIWELDSLVRRRIAENIVSTISTLKSLSQLVAEIPNMVVLDHIQTEVLLFKIIINFLHTGQYEIALQHAKKAIERAESAFFDPTMVSMLYFPDEHKYAIYMPLFVPISVPLLMALLKELKELKELKTKNKKKE
ncbi:phosphatidylinositol-glycan biosynthesis class S protein [Gigaspora rosea]|uniref:Phosphatidylinositol-glycan biosynthesis class S protein n=1 Tax=Gigaspora rosea TaxID=44941 RepID=A0A397TTT8_9GLOM|nr:phosphatidylinositol-glycan biosynthesis class S protein [Gigaspora rosea]